MGAAMNLVTEPADRVLVITRVFDAPRELVFNAWTRPEHMARWFGPRGFTSRSSSMICAPAAVIEFTCSAPTAIIGCKASIARSHLPRGW